jgi:phosphoenolpyruvate-protein kinase (PTS system EI component)
MSERRLLGLPAAGGVAVGRALVLRDIEADAGGKGGETEQQRALEALARVASELGETAERLRSEGRVDDAEILEANRLMAEDPSLTEEVRALAAASSAVAAVLQATERHAAQLEAIPDPMLAARAADVRRLGERAARLLVGAPALTRPLRATIVIARDLGPADIAELDLPGGRIRGLALAGGGATSHAAIMARSFGIPLVVGLGDEILGVEDGATVVLDGDGGSALLDPSEPSVDAALRTVHEGRRRRRELASARTLPAVTRDGRKIRLLCNASTRAEVDAGLAAGAEGVGLLRTELAFLESTAWPTEAEHAAVLSPTLAPLAGRIATVRTLDFGADKTPPFLSGIEERGLTLMLAHPDALAAQLQAIATAGAGTKLRILLPMVESAAQVRVVRELLTEPAELGAMIETPEAAWRAAEIAAEADFLSIGTNDLVQYTLGLDRERPVATVQTASDPEVLGHIARVVEAAHGQGLTVEICGEAAGEPELAARFVELGVDELSVAPARLDEIRATVRGISASSELGDERGEVVDGLGGVVA